MENKKLKVKALLFDLDGTILDSRRAYMKAMKTAFSNIGQTTVDIKTVTEIPKRIEQGLPIDDLIGKARATDFMDIYLKTYYESTANESQPINGVSETLRKLCGKAKLAITTMRCVPSERVVEELKNFKLAGYFQEVVTTLDTKSPKPSPEALIECARRLGVQVNECAAVGDSIVDVRAGKRAEAKTVAVLSGIFSREELEAENPDLILESVKNLPDFID
jgi:HAD superfamily hydrolase (TIGR01509 family)